MITKPAIKDVESYISSYPVPTQKLLKQLRSIIRKAAPAAEEVISYQMPAYNYTAFSFTLQGMPITSDSIPAQRASLILKKK